MKASPLLQWINALIVSIVLIVLSACGRSNEPQVHTADCSAYRPSGHWVAAWGAVPSDTGDTLADQSLRMIVSPRFHGGTIRIRLSNRFGAEPVTFSSAWIGLQDRGAALVAGSNRQLTFSCATSVTLAPGEEAVSDPLMLAFEPFENLAVSLHLNGGAGGASRHAESLQTSYVAPPAAGNQASIEIGDAFNLSTTSTYFLSAVETDAPTTSSVIVTFGDSITDGSVTTDGLTITTDPAVIDQNLRYPDFLARRLDDAGLDTKFSVVNAGIAGNRLLSDAMLGFPSFGQSGLSRLNADVIAAAGVTDAIILIGTNDLGMAPPATAGEVIAGLEQAIEHLHAAGINVLLGTQTPSYGLVVPSGHGLPYAVLFRNQINDWVRTQSKANGVIDFHAALRDPNNPDALNPIYDCGDHLHPNPAGYEAMAHAIDLGLFRGVR